MHFNRQLFFLLATFFFFQLPLSAQQKDSVFHEIKEKPLPNYIGRVNDFEQLFTVQQINHLTTELNYFENDLGVQMAIVSVPDFGSYTLLENYAVALFNYWGIGDKSKNNGLLLILSKAKREVRISTGYGLEKRLTDSECAFIIQDAMLPLLKQGNYYGAVEQALSAIERELK